MKFDRTELQAEEYAYPHGHETRAGRAIYPDGKVRRVWGGIPNMFFSIPAHGRISKRYVRGWLLIEGDDNVAELHFHLNAKYRGVK